MLRLVLTKLESTWMDKKDSHKVSLTLTVRLSNFLPKQNIQYQVHSKQIIGPLLWVQVSLEKNTFLCTPFKFQYYVAIFKEKTNQSVVYSGQRSKLSCSVHLSNIALIKFLDNAGDTMLNETVQIITNKECQDWWVANTTNLR